MSTLNKDGSGYEVTFRTKTAEGGYETVTKSTTELTEDDIKLLGDASQPKNLEDIAKEQLKVDEKQLAALLAIQHRAGYAEAGTKLGDDVLKTMEFPPDAISKLVNDVFPFDELIDDLNTGGGKLFETLGKTFDVMIGKGGSFEGLIVSLNEMGTSLEENIGDKGKKAFDSLTESFKKFTEENKTFGEAFKKISDAIKNLEGGESPDNNNSPGETRNIPVKDVLIQTLPEDSIREVGGNVTVAGTNLDGNMKPPDLYSLKNLMGEFGRNVSMSSSPMESKMSLTVNLNLNVNSNNSNIDTNQLKLALEDGAVVRQIIGQVESMGKNMIEDYNIKSSPYNKYT
jgi:ferritin